MANWVNEELYTYDMYGNQTGVEVYEINEEITNSEKAGDVRYSYDESNQMVQYETKGVEETEWTQAARNVYNGEGMRIRQYENGNDWARQYFYIGGALAISTDGSNENFVKSENILDPSGTILAARREAKDGEQIEGSAYWIYHYDAQGSATNLVGVKDGALYRAEENVYDAFGNEETGMKETVSSVQNDIKFTGATLDNSGTYYLGSRHYDPNTGRFLQQDTFKGDIYSPWTQNLYTYTSNNPVNYIDPTGYSKEQWALAEGMKYAMGEAKKQTNIFAALNTFMTSIPRGYNDALKRADAREKELRKELAGQVGKKGTQRQLVDSSVRVLQELTLLTDIEYGLTGRQIDKDLYEWVMESSGDSRSVMVGNVEGEGIFTLHSHLNKIGFGITVKNEMGVLHSGYDVDEFGDPLCRVDKSYVVLGNTVEVVDFNKAKQKEGFNNYWKKTVDYLRQSKNTNNTAIKPTIGENINMLDPKTWEVD